MKKKNQFCLLVTLLVLSVSIASGIGDGKLHIYFLNVGQGDATLIISSAGTSCLIDGGPSNSTTPFVEAMNHAINNGWTDNTLDYIVVTHFHADHMRALDEVHSLYPDGLIAAYDRDGSSSITAFIEYNNYFGTPGLNKRKPAETFALDDYTTMTYLGRGGGPPTDENNYGVVYRLDFKNFQCFFGGDIGGSYEVAKGQICGPVEVYKVNHHGSSTSSTQAFLNYIQPKAHIFSYAIGNPYGHPHQVVVDRLQAMGSVRFDTPIHNYNGKLFVYCEADGEDDFVINDNIIVAVTLEWFLVE